MKKISLLIGLLMCMATNLVLANAVATTVNGTAQVASGTAAARALRQGDVVRQGDTVSTGAASAVVLRFDDGQVAALTANSRMAVTTYTYNAQAQSGNVLLSLIDGGMRAVTGLIGRRSPQQVAYRAATATIGIRGTTVDIVTTEGKVTLTVGDGAISFSLGGQTVTVTAGQGVNAKADGTFQQAAANTIAAELAKTPEGQRVLNQLNGLQGLSAAISSAAAGSSGTAGDGPQRSLTNTPGPLGPQSGSAGGGTTSTR